MAIAAQEPGPPVTSATHTIALAPLVVPIEIDHPEPVRALFDSLIQSRVAEQGFALVPAEQYGKIWQENTASVGGFYDPYTGKVVDSLFSAVYRGTLQKLKEEWHADLWLHPAITVLLVPFGGGKVRWHGVVEEGGGTGGFAGFLFGRSVGTIPALSLVVRVADMRDTSVYVGRGGIQLLEKVSGGGFVKVIRDSLFVNAARDTEAVHLALDSLSSSLASKLRP